MKKIYLLLALNACTMGFIAQSPITLGNNNMPGSGDTLRYTNFALNSAGNYTQTGTNFSWDFSQVVSTSEGLRSFRNALQTPYALFFLSANEYGEKIADTIGAGPLTFTKYYNYYKKQNSPVSAFIADGTGMTYSSVPVPSYYSDKDELYFFPMTYPKYDSSRFKFSTALGGLLPVTYLKSGYRITVVDGWGSVTTPYGTESCLRLVTTQYAMDSIKNTLVPIPIGFPNYQRSYQWMTLGSKIPFVEITGNLIGTTFAPTLARYRGYKKEMVTVKLSEETLAGSQLRPYPNPVKDKLRLSGQMEGDYEVHSLEGKLLLHCKAEYVGGETLLDVSSLPSGVYFLKTPGDKKAGEAKFIKE